jgi:hypothetical protein
MKVFWVIARTASAKHVAGRSNPGAKGEISFVAPGLLRFARNDSSHNKTFLMR